LSLHCGNKLKLSGIPDGIIAAYHVHFIVCCRYATDNGFKAKSVLLSGRALQCERDVYFRSISCK